MAALQNVKAMPSRCSPAVFRGAAKPGPGSSPDIELMIFLIYYGGVVVVSGPILAKPVVVAWPISSLPT